MSRGQPGFVLGVSLSPRGYAFVLFSGPTTPYDWGIREIRGDRKSAVTLLLIKKLVRQYGPGTIILEKTDTGSRRGPRVRALNRAIDRLAEREGIRVVCYGRAKVRATFAAENAKTRPEIAKAIAEQIPAFAPKLPPLRKIWMSEDPRQSLFDAAALGLTFYARQRPDRRSRESAS